MSNSLISDAHYSITIGRRQETELARNDSLRECAEACRCGRAAPLDEHVIPRSISLVSEIVIIL